MNPSDSSADEFPLPHSTRALPRALIRLHQRCRGELVKEHKGWEMLLSADEARRTMDVIEELLKILRVDFRPDKLKPVVTVPKNGPFDYGGMVTATLEALGACDRWMTYNEIVDWVDAAYKLGLEGPARVRYLQHTREALHELKKDGFVECELNIPQGVTTKIQRWRLNAKTYGA
jgi:hypothetical protein